MFQVLYSPDTAHVATKDSLSTGLQKQADEWIRLFLCFLEHVGKGGKRPVRNRSNFFVRALSRVTGHMIDVSTVLVVVAIDAQILPVAPVCRIIVMVVIFVVNSKKMEVLVGEFPSATGAHPGMNTQ
jgi:hypothetical protein